MRELRFGEVKYLAPGHTMVVELGLTPGQSEGSVANGDVALLCTVRAICLLISPSQRFRDLPPAPAGLVGTRVQSAEPRCSCYFTQPCLRAQYAVPMEKKNEEIHS